MRRGWGSAWSIGAVVLAFMLAGCGGSSSGGGSPVGPGAFCNPGTQVQLASPLPSATGASPSIGQIIIVGSESNNTLYSTVGSWNLILRDNNGNGSNGSGLSLVPLPGGPHPFPRDFYYGSSIGGLNFGVNYSVS